ncbi:unnamed protein product [Closterium sp. NIES-53]
MHVDWFNPCHEPHSLLLFDERRQHRNKTSSSSFKFVKQIPPVPPWLTRNAPAVLDAPALLAEPRADAEPDARPDLAVPARAVLLARAARLARVTHAPAGKGAHARPALAHLAAPALAATGAAAAQDVAARSPKESV